MMDIVHMSKRELNKENTFYGYVPVSILENV